jgi:hypothetical protein
MCIQGDVDQITVTIIFKMTSPPPLDDKMAQCDNTTMLVDSMTRLTFEDDNMTRSIQKVTSSLPNDIKTMLPIDVQQRLGEFSRERTTAEMVALVQPRFEEITWERWMEIGMTPHLFLNLITKYTPGDEPPFKVRGMPNPTQEEFKSLGRAYKWLSWAHMESLEEQRN